MQRAGAKLQEDYFENTGGLNPTDSPFVVKPGAAAAGFNYEYTQTGGFKKRFGHPTINTTPDTQLKTLGIALRQTKEDSKLSVRVAGTKIQTFTQTPVAFTNLTQDTTASGSDFANSSSTVPVSDVMFTGESVDVLWLAGAGMSKIYGVCSDTKVTANGVETPTGVVTATVGALTGVWDATGNYRYAFAYHKASTGAQSNVALEISATIANTTDKVTLNFAGLTNLDTTLYDTIYIYRSVVNGAEGFTTGSIVAILPVASTTYVDTGLSVVDAQNVPRAGNLLLDNSTLPTNNYNLLTLFKRRLVTVKDSTIYISDLNKTEGWPIINRIPIATGGKITAIGVISFTTPTSSSIDEFLCVWKDHELWVISGDGFIDDFGLVDWKVTFIDNTGCSANRSVIIANGYVAWLSERGVFLWDGAGKPIYISRQIENYFGLDGEFDKSKFPLAVGTFYRKQNEIIWFISHKVYGEQKVALKLDLRLTLPQVSNTLGERVLDAIFITDNMAHPVYACNVQKAALQAEQFMIVGDNAGYLYRAYSAHVDGTTDPIEFEYETTYLNQNSPGVQKTYTEVIAWVEQLGDWSLTLDFWSNYRGNEDEKSTSTVKIGTLDNSAALWDVAVWDSASWDEYKPKPKPITFHLRSPRGNVTGDCIKLRFKQEGANQPITIYGYSIIYSEVGVQKR